ncbi:MAG: hypothetical protein ACFN1I_10510 [Selenomonas artemidis]
MIRDWCRAANYVLAGNLLSANCDLVCETPEGKAALVNKNWTQKPKN